MSTQHIITSNSSTFLSDRVFPLDTTLNIILIEIHVQSNLWTKDTLNNNYNFSCILCREVVLFSEIQNVLKLEGNQLFGTLKRVCCREVHYSMSLSQRVQYISEAWLQFSSITLPVLWSSCTRNLEHELRKSVNNNNNYILLQYTVVYIT